MKGVEMAPSGPVRAGGPALRGLDIPPMGRAASVSGVHTILAPTFEAALPLDRVVTRADLEGPMQIIEPKELVKPKILGEIKFSLPEHIVSAPPSSDKLVSDAEAWLGLIKPRPVEPRPAVQPVVSTQTSAPEVQRTPRPIWRYAPAQIVAPEPVPVINVNNINNIGVSNDSSDEAIFTNYLQHAKNAGIKPNTLGATRAVHVHSVPTEYVEEERQEEQEEEELVEESKAVSLDEHTPEIEDDEKVLEYRYKKAMAVIQNISIDQEEVDGNTIAQRLGGETEGDRSRIFAQLGIRDIPDPSYEKFIFAVSKIQKVSIKEALTQIVEALERYVPIKFGKSGKKAADEHIKNILPRVSIAAKIVSKKTVTKFRKIAKARPPVFQEEVEEEHSGIKPAYI